VKYEIKPVVVSHESIKALHIYEQCLVQDYELIVSAHNQKKNKHEKKALAELRKRLDDCKEAREFLEKHFVNQKEPEDATEY
jgi:hypothetical protein